MTTDTALIEKREELKRRLAAGEYKTLVDIFLEWFERLLRKITRQSKPLPLWFVTVALCVISVAVTTAAVYFAGDWTAYLRISTSFGFGFEVGILINIFNGFLGIIILIVINQYIKGFFILWKDIILDRTESLASLRKIESWIAKCCNWRLHLLLAIVLTILSIPFVSFLVNPVLGLPTGGYGLIFTNIVNYMFTYVLLYQFYMAVFLSSTLRNYDLKIFVADPGSSELMSRLSSELGFFVYLVAIYAAIFSFWISRLGVFASSLGVVVMLVWWAPIIALFTLNQTSLSSIIRRAKWKTLNEIQMKVEKLQASKNFGNQETMDAIKRLMDYHDRVKTTRNSALDFGTYLSFINSLLLPLLAFILGNLDLVVNLFARRP